MGVLQNALVEFHLEFLERITVAKLELFNFFFIFLFRVGLVADVISLIPEPHAHCAIGAAFEVVA